MKYPVLLSIIALTGCSTPKAEKIAIAHRSTCDAEIEASTTVRHPEVIKGYHLGRYVDPQNRLVMHEGHRFYRIESLTSWNLNSQQRDKDLPVSVVSLTNRAFHPPPLNDAAVAELNRQREITQGISRQAESLNQSLSQFRESLAATRAVAEQSRLLRQQITNAVQRLEALERVAKLPAPAPSAAEDSP